MRKRVSVVLKVILPLGILLAMLRISPGQSVAPHITQTINDEKRMTLKGNTHPLARPQFDRGVAPNSLPMERMMLVLKRSPEQETALDLLLDEQQDNSSQNFHKWLTPEQFGEQFGPADADIQAVTGWLAAKGFRVNRVSTGRTVIEFSGDASLMRSGFHTEIHEYVVNGEEHWANNADPQIPAAIAPVVGGVVGLNNFYLNPMHHLAGIFSRSRATGQVNPLFTFAGGICSSPIGLPTCYAVGPFDFATIYNLLPLWNTGIDGTGQTIAIVGKSNVKVQDIRDFRSMFGLPAKDPDIIIPPGNSDPGVTGDESETEAVLDIEWSGAVAKNSTIKFVTAASSATDGAIISATFVVNTNLAPILSVSFGNCELFLGSSLNAMFNGLWQQAAAQGMTILVASGDQGSAGCDVTSQPPSPAMFGLEVSGVSSTPFNVAVGGTDFDDFGNATRFWNTSNSSANQSSAKSYIPEIPWNQSCTNARFGSMPEVACNSAQLVDRVVTIGGGGGASSCTSPSGLDPSSCSGGYPKPVWQKGTGVPNDGKRDVPDVSLFASSGFNGSFYIVCQSDQTPSTSCNLNSPFTNFLAIGGTSAASPAFAGIMALVNQKTGSTQGNANPTLYALAAKQSLSACNSSQGPANTCIFNDVTSGTNAMPCLNPSPNCNVSNPADPFGVLSGFSATTGYDLATGLGSVNATNLVNNWTSAGVIGQFSVSSNPESFNFAAGNSGTSTITVSGTNGFTGVVNLTCGVSPIPVNSPPTCFVLPSSVTLNANTSSAAATLKISTNAGLNGEALPANGSNRQVYLASGGALALMGIFLVAVKQRRNGWASSLGLFALVFLGVILSCCGGGGGSSQINLGTPTGGYTVTVAASSGGTTQSTSVLLNVQ